MFRTDTPLTTPPSHAGVQTPVDLVPSRYAVRIGAIDAMVVSDGVLPLPTSTMATNADPADLADWLGPHVHAARCVRLAA